MTSDRYILILPMVKCTLAYHWSFLLYDVIFCRYYKLLQKCLQKKRGEIANLRGWIKGSPPTPSLTRAYTSLINNPKTAENQNPVPATGGVIILLG